MLRLTATDSKGLTDSTSVRLDPKTVNVTLKSSPGGLKLTLNGRTLTAPFTTTLIEGSTNSLIAPSPQTKAGKTYVFSSWADGASAATRTITANTTSTYAANHKPT